MQEDYAGRLLEDGHLSIPKEVIDKLKINKGSRLRVRVEVEGEPKKEKILGYAGLLSDLTEEEVKRFDDSIRRRSFFGEKKVEI
jgi:bifunctional DNA-binding transcriptional regulator/antitoxin component of YhaV-PrlF toxin-antitoxin module